MEQVTLGQTYDVLKFIVEFLGLLGTIFFTIRKYLKAFQKKTIETLNETLEALSKNQEKLDLNQCENFLVRFLADVEHGQQLNDVEIKRAYDVYDHYKYDLNGNSYIKDKWEKLMK